MKYFYNHYEAFHICCSTFKSTDTVTNIITENEKYMRMCKVCLIVIKMFLYYFLKQFYAKYNLFSFDFGVKHTWTWFCEIHAGRVWVISPKTALRIWLDDSQSVITHNLMPLSRNNSRTWWGCLLIKVHHFKGKAKKGIKSYAWKKKKFWAGYALVRAGPFYMSTTTCTIILTKIINKHIIFFSQFTRKIWSIKRNG